ncbi:MAG TPA: trypsin-like peptidase domain-containing protein [Gaiellaceae bacterium]|nr:trypsin-like peptidase domain-containing protein [Gaiellaceae bacterium]
MAGQRPLAVVWLVVAGALGAGLALGGAALAGGLGGTTTTIREVSPASPTAVAIRPSAALSINDIYRRSAPGVVQVTSTSVVTVPADPFFGGQFFPEQQQQQSLGSGFVVDKAGHVVTNYHVVQGARKIRVSFSNGASMKAAVVGTDPSSDLAVLKIDASSRALTPLPLGDSDLAKVGDPVVAIGNPFGLDRTVTAGIVSAIQRAITAPNGYTIDHVIQTDAAINHGNSGGPLLNGRGDVIGVNSQIETGDNSSSSGNVGVGFAIPSNTVKAVIAQLIRQGHIDRAFIGIGAVPITRDLARVFRLPVARGLLVQSVQPGSGASRAGLRPGTTQVVLAGESYNLGGDIIVTADGKPLAGLNTLRDLVAAKKPGDTIALVVYRNGKKTTLLVKLGRQPGSATG